MGREQHPRRTDPALRRPVLDECLLKSRQPSAVSQPLDRGDLTALTAFKTNSERYSRIRV